MKTGKRLSIALVLVLILSVFAGCGGGSGSSSAPASSAPPASTDSGSAEPAPSDAASGEGGELVIGMMQDLTGTTGQQGTGAQRGVQMAVEEINAAGGLGGTTIRLVEYDIKGDVTESINAYKRLVEQDKVNIVIAPHISNIGIAIAPLTDTYKIPVVGAYIDDRTVLKDDGSVYPYAFISQPSATQQATVAAKYAMEELGAKNFGILYNSANAYCVSLQEPFVKYVEANGGTVVAIESFQDTDKDYRTQLTKIKGTNPDAIYMPNYPAQVPLCIQQTRELGIEAPIIGANGFIPQVYLVGESAEATTYIPYNISYDNTAISEFDAKFQEQWNFETNAQTYIAMDALSMIQAAFEKCGSTDPEALTAALNGVTVEGWMGTFSVSPDTHMPVGMSMAIINVVGGKPNTVTTMKTDG